MKAWDIWSFQPPGWSEPHPAVIVSHSARVANKPEVNVLICSSKPPTRPAKDNEVILDAADGLSWPTLCKCDYIFGVEKSALNNYRGHVSEERRKAILRTMLQVNDWII